MRLMDLTDSRGQKIYVNPYAVLHIQGNPSGKGSTIALVSGGVVDVKEAPPDVEDTFHRAMKP